VTAPLSPERLAEYRALSEQIAADPWLLSDCEGWLKIWRVSALKNVTRDENGEIDGFREPSSYRVVDLIVEDELDSWDPGEDADDDQRRADIGSMFTAREALPVLLAENARLAARVAELERPEIERKRGEIHLSYMQLAAQAREDGDYENEATVLQRLEAREAEWAAEDAEEGWSR
jgi:hypothetical protein